MRNVLQLMVSIEGTSPPAWRRILAPAHLTLRRAHRMLEEAFGRNAGASYVFAQDGRLFGDQALHDDYIEDDAAFRLSYCLCLPGHTLEYVVGPWRHSILLESMGPGQAKQWRLIEGEGAPAPAEAA